MTKAPVGIEIAGESERMFHGQAAPPAADRWRAAEGRLYPLITVDPALYEAAITLVCEAADVLRSKCGTPTELVHVDAIDVLSQCPSAPLMSALGFDPGTAFDAACAYRWRELRMGQPAERDVSPGGRP
ncbi:MAG: hypothetical protein ACRDVG_11500 [Jatrophihabitantaceae bacterium]